MNFTLLYTVLEVLLVYVCRRQLFYIFTNHCSYLKITSILMDIRTFIEIQIY